MANTPDDIQRQIDQINSMRSVIGEVAADAAIAALRAQVAPPENVEGKADVDGDNYGQNIGVNTGTVQQYISTPQPDRQREQQRQDLINYLRSLRSSCRTLHLGQIDEDEAGFQHPMYLDQVYVRLHTLSQVEMTDAEIAAAREQGDRRFRLQRNEDERPRRPLTAVEALNHPHPVRVMLLGAPGSGKSTLVNYLTLCLVGATLCARHPDEPQPEGGWLACVPDWTHSAVLPVRIILHYLAESEAIRTATQGSVAVFRAYVKQVLHDHGDALGALKADLSSEHAMLLFDGLDEVVGEPVLSRVVEIIQAVQETYTRCPVLVTCRVLDYEANRRRPRSGFSPSSSPPGGRARCFSARPEPRHALFFYAILAPQSMRKPTPAGKQWRWAS